MSEWDYLPTPYQSLIETEAKNSLLTFMSFCCLCSNKTLLPSDIFLMCEQKKEYNWILNDIISRTSLEDVIRTVIQYEDARTQKKRQKVIEIFRNHVRRTRTENI